MILDCCSNAPCNDEYRLIELERIVMVKDTS